MEGGCFCTWCDQGGEGIGGGVAPILSLLCQPQKLYSYTVFSSSCAYMYVLDMSISSCTIRWVCSYSPTPMLYPAIKKLLLRHYCLTSYRSDLIGYRCRVTCYSPKLLLGRERKSPAKRSMGVTGIPNVNLSSGRSRS